MAKGSIQMHNLYRDIPDLNKVCPDDNMDNYLARKQHREQMVRIGHNVENLEISEESCKIG